MAADWRQPLQENEIGCNPMQYLLNELAIVLPEDSLARWETTGWHDDDDLAIPARKSSTGWCVQSAVRTVGREMTYYCCRGVRSLHIVEFSNCPDNLSSQIRNLVRRTTANEKLMLFWNATVAAIALGMFEHTSCTYRDTRPDFAEIFWWLGVHPIKTIDLD